MNGPETDALLSAVDTVMNSNTLLVTGRADSPEAFVRDPAFPDRVRAADETRGWFNLQDEPITVLPVPLTLTRLDRRGFRARLLWMLCDSFSPYRKHLTPAEAEPIVDSFLSLLAGGGDWTYWDANPDFLPSTGYYSHVDPPPGTTAYFDGGDSDTATFLCRGDEVILLLTNGSP
ncbi:hypothetical protein [Actinoplanes philippinensis]|uniref:hypothetical protein n=1 Tax=Actinoplanes philippinensis TaxID=35752 RepID=UPI0033E0EB73